jgi:Na+-translocating ferredoxin:NAD+ oxidoreductase RnfD subunit
MIDPRLYQIATLASLLVYGMGWLEFGVTPARVGVVLLTVVAMQAVCDRWNGASVNVKSALISGLSLCLLLRTNRTELAVLAAVIAIVSKFVIRYRGKHLFNPTNGGLVAMLLLTNQVWVSPGQWGSVAAFAFLMACVGGLVVNRAARADVTYAFIAFYCTLMFGRSIYLGEPLAIPFHRLESGALLLFTFFMISDPKTTPNSRAGRVLFAGLVAFTAWYVQFRLFRTNGLLWSLAAWSLAVPLIDRLLPGGRYAWSSPRIAAPPAKPQDSLRWRSAGASAPALLSSRYVQVAGHYAQVKEQLMKRAMFLVVLASMAAWSTPAWAFCGFYVGKADTRLFNQASQVVLARDGDRTVMTMASDFKGELKEFAVVIPVPTFLKREQIHVGEQSLVDHLDAYSAPRLVEYFDTNPCDRRRFELAMAAAPASRQMSATDAANAAKSLGVTIEAQYTVGEYDILILSAQQSSGLETWLRDNGYRIPPGAAEVLSSYLKQNMRFFVAKVNLTEQAKLGFSYLRPLQVAYESPKFMLPIRLGMVNANGPQDLFVYALTRNGRVETTNYRTTRLPSDVELPVYLKDQGEFSRFYKAMFTRQVQRQGGRTVFLEYAWDMKWCDPCAANPLSNSELRQLGVFWDDGGGSGNQPPNVFVTRLHVRYDNAHFPEDLVFQETADRANFQGRYVLRHAWKGQASCAEATVYRAALRDRHEQEVVRLASLTGWSPADIRKRAGLGDTIQPQPAAAWYERLWKK